MLTFISNMFPLRFGFFYQCCNITIKDYIVLNCFTFIFILISSVHLPRDSILPIVWTLNLFGVNYIHNFQLLNLFLLISFVLRRKKWTVIVNSRERERVICWLAKRWRKSFVWLLHTDLLPDIQKNFGGREGKWVNERKSCRKVNNEWTRINDKAGYGIFKRWSVIYSGILVTCVIEHHFVPYSLHLNCCNFITND